jgi:protein-S-isoprenylcysteine O-methyltransferase Ste14
LPGVSFSKRYADFVARLRVPGGFVLVAAFLWLSTPSWPSLALGLPISIAGLAIRAWAAGHLEKNVALADSGPYAWVRNPLYLGTLTVAIGFVFAARRWELGVLFGVVFVLIYLPVMELEEQHLGNLFPAYLAYSKRVPKLVPRPPTQRGARGFRWSLYRYNREYQALLGFVAGAAVLCWKAAR